MYLWPVSRRHGSFYRGINRVGTKLLGVNATLGEHNLLIQRREGGFGFAQVGFATGAVDADSKSPCFTAWLSVTASLQCDR